MRPNVIWGEEHPLPYPCWAAPVPAVTFSSVSEYEEFVRKLEEVSSQQLHQHSYNTIGGFVRFYEAWKQVENGLSFQDFFRSYEPPIVHEHYTCVGLIRSLRSVLVSTLGQQFPFLHCSLYYASCEEKVWNAERYMEQNPPCLMTAEKEHVMMAMKLKISSEAREGVMLLDPGYHMPMPITCMVDRRYPHTGIWLHRDGTSTIKEYSYELNEAKDYIKWNVEVIKPEKTPLKNESLIYIDLPYLSKVTVSERRNLVFPLKSWVKRDMKGRIPAGIYFSIPESLQDKQLQIGAFYLKGTERVVLRQNVADKWSDEWTEQLLNCSHIIEVDPKVLFSIIQRLCTCLQDKTFLQEIKVINDKIYEMSVDN